MDSSSIPYRFATVFVMLFAVYASALVSVWFWLPVFGGSRPRLRLRLALRVRGLGALSGVCSGDVPHLLCFGWCRLKPVDRCCYCFRARSVWCFCLCVAVACFR